jgi:CheY-like chemotaxis protein
MDNRNFTVLLVEDDLNDIFLVKRAFKIARVQNPLQVVTDGQEATLYLKGEGRYQDRQNHPLPKLIVMDIKMPRRTGFEVLEWLKEHPQYRVIPTIVLTSSKLNEDVVKAYGLGANSYMVKPSSLDGLTELVDLAFRFWTMCEIPPLPKKCQPVGAR